ncbi:SIS domain-containing protein [Lysinibacillus mangiferihumi]|uniref:SIS domain-containing protein n=1 Tax=Lysinibacillus mangiferihumi TaxID=1130819 RepID=A0A4U2Z2X1_9BACI|nr:SIS domain-containing protein [Lysinibacillus mangiferihumi]TKI67672.1 SIS domain-containing protein [Lysinibacillus mangiferihumi]
MFNLNKKNLSEMKALQTAVEIYQQPTVWVELISSLIQKKENTQNFIQSICHKHRFVRVIFTGAGTSAFAGDTLVPVLRKYNQKNKCLQFESIPTTDIVSNPMEYLIGHVPTIMVSFARSGNSPESVAAVSLGKEIIQDFYQVIVTCNKDGKLAKNTEDDENSITILTPDKANDQAMAMTSSFTSMIIAAFTVFVDEDICENSMKAVIESGKRLVDTVSNQVDEILEFDFERIIYLGSGILGQLSHEAALKMLELSSGQVVAMHESSLGFRHGPKSILNDKTVVVLFVSQNPHTRKYDLDILREISSDPSKLKVVVLTDKSDAEVEKLADWVIPVSPGNVELSSDFDLALLYVIFAQVFAMKKSLQLGITPDNPSPNGRINRVVQGVTIYDYIN